jgi:maltooligosyltrehalose trehalohydrolase
MTLDKYAVGASSAGETTRFRVWAPQARTVALHLIDDNRPPVEMEREPFGYYATSVKGVVHGARYRYVLNGTTERPDPASHYQPEGVHGPSMVIDHSSFQWTDARWEGVALENLILYELHVGTFSEQGTFDGIIPYLAALKEELGITAIEIMPVAQFPGERNWGYDGTYLYAAQNSYGGPEGLKRLVNACHAIGLAVILDVVYNHLGPEGNYLGEFGPYFTNRYRTPWGEAINYDGPESDPVRQFVLQNALYWVTHYHVDGLRLDAIHGIYDLSALHIVNELSRAIHRAAEDLRRPLHVITESDLNDVRVLTPHDQGGFAVDAQWSDDFHHALWVTLTKERKGYYEDFNGLRDLATAIQNGFVYSGQYSPHRRRRHGNASNEVPPSRFVVCSQNHDQVGNRAVGDRLSARLTFEGLKAAAAAVLLGPNIPFLFMGEEYAESAPFQYFVSHSDKNLIEAVRTGRRQEFAAFGWEESQIPDPQDEATFERSRLTRRMNTGLRSWYRALIALRKATKSLHTAWTTTHHRVWCLEDEQLLLLQRWTSKERDDVLVVISFNPAPVEVRLAQPHGQWHLALHSGSREFGGGEEGPSARLRIPSGDAVMVQPFAVSVFTLAS